MCPTLNSYHTAKAYRIAIAGAALFSLAQVTSAGAQSPGDFVPVTDAMLQNPAPADWLMFRRTLDSWGYSPLD